MGKDEGVKGLWLHRNVWLNQYSSQLLPIVALIALRVFVGLGDSFLRLVTKPKKDPMQVSGRSRPPSPLALAQSLQNVSAHLQAHHVIVQSAQDAAIK